MPPMHLAQAGSTMAAPAPLAVVENAHVHLVGKDLERVLVIAGGEQHLDELLDERLGQRPCRRAG